ncbi:MAG: hypothetical protein ACRD6R_09270, partial [Candidatus Polarisedimenticolia bacterium]
MSDAPLFSALVVSRPSPNGRRLRRLRSLVVAACLHAATFGGLVLAPLLIVEMVEPQASTDPILIYYPPRSGGHGDGRPLPAIRRGEGGPPSSARHTAESRERVRPEAPTAITPVAPPEPPVEVPADFASHDPAGPGEGDGTGHPDGTGKSTVGVPDGCQDCPDPGTGGGRDGPDWEILGPDDPRVTTRPVLIDATKVLPRYPDAARRARLQGEVVLLIVIRTDGT